MKALLNCTVNGEDRSVLADTRDTLLTLLRDRLGLTGAKEGCGNGNCGTCTVLMDGAPINACLVLAVEVPGHSLTTLEGLFVRGALPPLQQAIGDHRGTPRGSRRPRSSLPPPPHPPPHPQPAQLP